MNNSLIESLQVDNGMPSIFHDGKGVPFHANSSAISLPGLLLFAGTQTRLKENCLAITIGD